MGPQIAAERSPGAATHAAVPVLRFRGLSKHFGGEKALDNVDFSVLPGEVHGLLGQNGSGKSTLIKVLAGYHEPSPGAALELYGHPVPLPLAPGRFREYGISFVHQHLGLIPSLTVVENLFIGELATRSRWAISWPRARARARALFEEYGLPIDPAAAVADLSPVQRALLAIVRAVFEMKTPETSNEGGLLVLDEPTPFLPRTDVERLFGLIRDIVARGFSVIFVSHDVDEVLEITDRATILRDGRVAGTLETRSATKDDFVGLIVGRKVETVTVEHHAFDDRTADIAIRGLDGGILHDLSIALHRGEVVGLTGLIGSGYDDVLYRAYGARKSTTGRLVIGDQDFDLAAMDPKRAIGAGIVLIPGDRQHAGAVGGLSVAENVSIPVLGTRFNPWLLHRRRIGDVVRRLGDEFEVRPNRPDLPFDALSGGNQQKAVLAKWLQANPRLILLDEPTQGVDVGARQTVFAAIKRASEAGAAILCASSDYEQLAVICDRVLVFSRGHVTGELTGDMVNKDTIAERCYHSVDSVLRARPDPGELSA